MEHKAKLVIELIANDGQWAIFAFLASFRQKRIENASNHFLSLFSVNQNNTIVQIIGPYLWRYSNLPLSSAFTSG